MQPYGDGILQQFVRAGMLFYSSTFATNIIVSTKPIEKSAENV